MTDLSETRAPQLQAIVISFCSVAVVSSLLRCYTRVFIVRAFGLDDWVMLAATIFFSAYTATSLTATHFGIGRHQESIPHEDYLKAMEAWWFCYIWYGLAMFAARISIGIFFLRLAVRRMHVWIVYLIMLDTVLIGMVFLFVCTLECTPVSYFWYKDQDGWCMSSRVITGLTYLYSVFGMICDFTFAVLPVFLIRSLQMDRQTKFALIPILGMGCIASIAVLARFPYIVRLADATDFTWSTIDIPIWSTIEQGLAITAGNLGTIRPLFRRVADRLGLWNSTSRRISDINVPHTIGSLGKPKRENVSHQGLFGLATFRRGDDLERGVEEAESDPGASKQSITITTDIAITSNRSDLWEATRGNESQSELCSKVSKETLNTNGTTLTPSSVLLND